MPSGIAAVERLAPVIQEQVAASEAARTLARPVVDALKEAGLFRHLAPAALGGAQPDPVEWFRTVEAAARIDASVGWCLFINGATGLVGRTLREDIAEAIVGDPDTVVAGAVFPFNKAVAVDGGFRVTGRWPFASGCKHATHLIAFCAVHDGDVPRVAPNGFPDLRIMLAPSSSARIIDTWDVVGLEATGSHDIEFHDAFVPETHAIALAPSPPNRFYQAPLYQLPFLTLFAWPIGAVALGIAQHAIDIVAELAGSKVAAGTTLPLSQRPLFHLQLAEATANVRSARAWLHEAIEALFETAKEGRPADLAARANAQLATSNATRAARAATETMYLAGGGSSVYRKNGLQRCMRDMHALSQHVATGPGSWENVGAMLAGQPTQNPLILI